MFRTDPKHFTSGKLATPIVISGPFIASASSPSDKVTGDSWGSRSRIGGTVSSAALCRHTILVSADHSPCAERGGRELRIAASAPRRCITATANQPYWRGTSRNGLPGCPHWLPWASPNPLGNDVCAGFRRCRRQSRSPVREPGFRAITPPIGLSSPVSSASAPVNCVCTRAAARAM